MNETEKPKQPLPLWRRLVLIGVLGAIVLLLGVMLASYIAGKQLGEELVKIDQQGEPLTFIELAQADAGRLPYHCNRLCQCCFPAVGGITTMHLLSAGDGVSYH